MAGDSNLHLSEKVLLDVCVCTNGDFTAATESWGKAKVEDVDLDKTTGTAILTVPATAEKGFMILKSKGAASSNRSGRPDTADIQHDCGCATCCRFEGKPTGEMKARPRRSDPPGPLRRVAVRRPYPRRLTRVCRRVPSPLRRASVHYGQPLVWHSPVEQHCKGEGL